MYAVNDAKMKSLFDNRYGTGQSVWDGIFRSTNLLIAGKSVVVVGYGWTGRGIALRARGLGARVTICEVNPVNALEAWMEGLAVAPVAEAIRTADLLITATGCADAVPASALPNAKDGLVIWPAASTHVNEMSLFISGISGETARVTNPATGENIILRKTLQRDYLVRGDALARGSRPAELVAQQWVLR